MDHLTPPSPPFSIDHYLVKRELGRGGQGIVYLAFDEHLEVDVAIKVLLPEYRTPEFIVRLKTEAQVLVRLNHVNIVRFFSFNPSKYYLVLEYCEGGELTALLNRRRPLSAARIVSIVRQVCEALAHAQELGRAHRDIKPGNILFRDGVPKVSDFGLAKLLSSTSSLTRTRGMLGTVQYASPEQLRDASRVDERTDLWSVGIVLYELLTWRHPFSRSEREDPLNFFVRVRTAPPYDPPCEVPAPLLAVVHRALQKDPGDRFASAREMMQALDAALEDLESPDELLLPPAGMVGEVEQLAGEVADLLQNERTGEAEQLLARMKSGSPEHSLVSYYERLVRKLRSEISRSGDRSAPRRVSGDTELDQRIHSITSYIGEGQFGEARQLIGDLLGRHPENPALADLLAQLQEQERRFHSDLNSALDAAARARAGGDMRAALQVWEDMAGKYVKHQTVRNELIVARREWEIEQRKDAIEEAEAEVQRCRERGELHGERDVWGRFLEQFPGDPRALEQKQILDDRIGELERSEQIARLEREAKRLEQDDRLEQAQEKWATILALDSAHAHAAESRERLAGRIGAARRDRRAAELREVTETRVASGDLAGALRLWEAFLADYPDDEEGCATADQLRARQHELHLSDLLTRLGQARTDLDERLSQGRYRSLVPEQAAVQQALERTVLSAESAPSVVEEAIEIVTTTQQQAEETLVRERQVWREELFARWTEASALVEGDAAPTSAENGPAEAIREGLAALVREYESGDPLAPLAGAAKRLQQAVAAFHQEKRVVVDAARTSCAAAIDESRQGVAFLRGPLGQRLAEGIHDELSEELERLDLDKLADRPERLREVEQRAAVFAARVGSLDASSRWDLAFEARALVRSARDLLVRQHDREVRGLLLRMAEALERIDQRDEEAAAELVQCRDELKAAVARLREQLKGSHRDTAARWNTALTQWRELLVGDLGPEMRTEGARLETSGQHARDAGNHSDLGSWTEQLEGLIRRYRLESIWIESSDAIHELEGPIDTQGVPLATPEPELAGLLGSYREAAAAGDDETARTSARHIVERRAEFATSRPWRPADVPRLGAAARKLNERYQPEVVERYDSLLARWETAVEQQRKAETGRLERELVALAPRLLEPRPRLWGAVAGVALVVFAAVAGHALYRVFTAEQLFRVAVLHPFDQRSPRIWWDGTDQGEPLSDAGGLAVWELAPGSYEAGHPSSPRAAFEVPERVEIVVQARDHPNAGGRVEALLEEWLGQETSLRDRGSERGK